MNALYEQAEVSDSSQSVLYNACVAVGYFTALEHVLLSSWYDTAVLQCERLLTSTCLNGCRGWRGRAAVHSLVCQP